MIAILVSGGVGLLVALLGTPAYIRFLVARGYGQFIRDDGPTSHHTKRGTPTMGGAVVIAAVVLGYAAAHVALTTGPTASGVLVIGLMIGLGAVGFADDFIKISKQRSLGLRSLPKLAGQAGVGLAFAVLALMFPDSGGRTPASTAISFTRDTPLDLANLGLPHLATVVGTVLFIVWVLLITAATSNGVNLTDGLDGLASSATAAVAAAYVLIGIWQSNQSCKVGGLDAVLRCYPTRDPLDVAVVASALAGACIGFLWWNTSPAKIFMGDTGSLAMGGALAGLAVVSRTELLLVVLGGLFVIITLSVVIQVGSFKLTRRRVFRMAPLQHHFELVGWAEVTIVTRFVIVAILFVALGLGIFYAEWIVGSDAG